MRWTIFSLLAVACGTGRPGTDAPAGGGTLLQTGADGMRAIRPEALRAHVLFLADDALEHYHQPSDQWRDGEYRADWLAKEVRLDFLIGLSIARAPARPAWNAGDVFAATFAAAGAR